MKCSVRSPRISHRKPLPIFFTVALMLMMHALTRAAPGALDGTFGVNGVVITSFRQYSEASSVAVQPDGKIVVAGNTYLAGTNTTIVVARYNADGSLDHSFGTGGQVFATENGSASAIAIQPDGRIVVVGSVRLPGIDSSSLNFLILRFNIDGSPDDSFGHDGEVELDMDSSEYAGALALQSNGKIIVVGGSGNSISTRSFVVIRLNDDGLLDGSFDGDGIVSTSCGCRGASAVALQADARIVAAGDSGRPRNSGSTLVRYNPDGSLDLSFDGDGIMNTEVGDDFHAPFSSVAIQRDGKIVATSSASFSVARFNVDGSVDTTFNGGGAATTFFTGDGEWASSIVIQSNGKIIAAGPSSDLTNSRFALARYDQNGSLDSTFDGDGRVTTDVGSNYDKINDIAIQSNGYIIAVGYSRNGNYGNSTKDFALVRYMGDSLESLPAVSVSGRVTTPDGRGIRNAVVSLTDSLGARRTSTSSSFGLYTFNNVAAGDRITVAVTSRRYRFTAQTLDVNNDLTALNFVGQE